MQKPMSKCLWFVVVLVVGIGGFSLAMAGLARADTTDLANPLERTLEPVIVTGAVVRAFEGVPVNQLFVYVHTDGIWQQIPAQVDEVTVTGWYTTTEDGRLDADDEIVFMAKDLGDQAQGEGPMENGRPVALQWYEVEVADPTAPAGKGWAYLVWSGTRAPTFTDDYVDFDPTLRRIIAQGYRLGFGALHLGIEYLALGSDPTDVLDRTKLRVFCNSPDVLPELCPLTEEVLPGSSWPDGLIADGPVRVIARGGRVIGYASMLKWQSTFFIPRVIAGDIRFSTDFSAAVSGATFYSAVVPQGVTVDGITDTVPAEPVSPWWQLSTDFGTVVQVSDTSTAGGTQTNYYVDDATVDTSDTGDGRHYGEVGIYVAKPERSFTYTSFNYYLPGNQPNVGATYADHVARPLSVSAHLQSLGPLYHAYLPMVGR